MALVKIISGEKNSGKTSLASKLVMEYGSRGKRVAGFLSVSESKAKDSYFFKNIETEELFKAVAEIPPSGDDGWRLYDFSKFYFSDSAFTAANSILEKVMDDKGDDDSKKPGIVVIDEIGPLELSGRGFLYSVQRLIREFSGTIIIVIRESLVNEFINRLGLINPEILKP